MNYKKSTCTYLAGVSAFCAYALILRLLSGFPFNPWVIVSGIVVGSVVYSAAVFLTWLYGRTQENTCAFTIATTFAVIAFFGLVTAGNWDQFSIHQLVIVSGFGIATGLAGSYTARCFPPTEKMEYPEV